MAAPIASQVGKRLRMLREAAGLTQAELAKLSLKSIETISNFERGRTAPSLATLAQLAGHLRVPVREFFEDRPVEAEDDPDETAIRNKARLLAADDRQLLIGIIDLMNARAGQGRTG